MTETLPAVETTATGHPSAPVLARQQGMNPVDYMRSRGYVHTIANEDGLRELFAAGPVTYYQGFDPTGPSLHAGHMVGVMMLGSLQRMGHRPIALGGGGTAMVGDPSGRTSTRELIREEDLADNLKSITVQLNRYLDYDGGRFGDNPAAISLDNAAWLLGLRYIPFLRDIGRHFSVNEMLATETYRERLASTGLNFVEFNYRLVQAYDFLHLFREEGCRLQLGGSDQWSNIIAGVDLVRRADAEEAYALVSPLVTTASGEKMGKTGGGVRVWLDLEMFSPYDYYQYWVNADDAMLEPYLKMLTFLPLDVIEDLLSVRGAALNEAKRVLALEATALAHGLDAAFRALAASSSFMSMVVSGLTNHLKDQAAVEAVSLPTRTQGSEVLPIMAPPRPSLEPDVDLSDPAETSATRQPFTDFVIRSLDPYGTNPRTAELITSILERPQVRAEVAEDTLSEISRLNDELLEMVNRLPIATASVTADLDDSMTTVATSTYLSVLADDDWAVVAEVLATGLDLEILRPALTYEHLFPQLSVSAFGLDPKAVGAAESNLFGALPEAGKREELLPTTTIPTSDLGDSFTVADAFVAAGLAKGRGEARRLAQQGGLRADDAPITDVGVPFASLLGDRDAVTLRVGKKRFMRVVVA